jgi:hypothetical protein
MVEVGWPAAEVLAATRASLPPFLDAAALGWCERVAAEVPLSARSHYLECRLSGDPRIDWLCYFDRIEACSQYHRAMANGRHSSSWRSNLALLRAWATPGTPLSKAPGLWFEYDAPRAHEPERPDASPSVLLEPSYYLRHVEPPAGLEHNAAALTHAALALLLNERGASSAATALKRCFGALPAQAAIGYVSVMTARNPVTTKLFVILPRASVDTYLRDVRWPGDSERAVELLNDFYHPAIRTAYLDLTLTTRVEQRLGIATSQFQQREVQARESQTSWLRLPERLVAEQRALAGWPGVTRAALANRRARIERWLDLKAVLDGDRAEYKAYLGMMASLPPAFE